MTVSMQTIVANLRGSQRDVLRSVGHVGPASGATVRADIESARGPMSHGLIYPNLDKLDEMGLIEKTQTPENNRANQYAMTQRGWDVIAFFAGAYDDAGAQEPEEVPA